MGSLGLCSDLDLYLEHDFSHWLTILDLRVFFFKVYNLMLSSINSNVL